MAKHIGIDKILIPYATNRKAALLTVVVPEDICVIVVQVPVPCIDTIALARRPKVAVVTHIAVITTAVATVPTRKRIKSRCTKFSVIL